MTPGQGITLTPEWDFLNYCVHSFRVTHEDFLSIWLLRIMLKSFVVSRRYPNMLYSSLYIPVGNLQQKICIFSDELILSVQYMYLSRGDLIGGESPILAVISPLMSLPKTSLEPE